MQLKHQIQDLIDSGLVSMGSPITTPNQNLGILNNPLPRHDVNQMSSSINMDQTYHNLDPPSSYDLVG